MSLPNNKKMPEQITVPEGRQAEPAPRTHGLLFAWTLWLPTTALLLVCCLLCVASPNAVWAMIAVRHAHILSERLFSLQPRRVFSSHAALITSAARRPVKVVPVKSIPANFLSVSHPAVTLSVNTITSAPASAPAGSTIRYAPRPGFSSRMVGGQFQGSADGVAYTTLATITQAPASAGWNSVTLPISISQYRYLRYLAPNGAYGNIAEMEFDSGTAASAAKICGTPFGTTGSYNNSGNGILKVFDGSVSTFFDAPYPGNADFVGIDQGTGSSGGQVRFAPRPGFASRMVGGVFQGSADGTSYTTIATISITPADNQYNTISTSVDPAAFRFLRYLAPDGTCGNIAELEFDSNGAKLTGTGFGTPGSWHSLGNTFGKALDGSLGSFFDAPAPGSGDFVGIDRGPAAVAPPVPAPPAPVQLPIEVMGADGTSVSVQVSVPNPAAVTGLWMQAHNLSYADKASVQINGGPWMPLDNNTVQVEGGGRDFGGIGGGFSTLKMLLPLPSGSVKAGTNTLSFRFNQTDGVSSGFRILAFNFLDAGGQPLLPASAFVNDDPNTWQPPLPDAGSIAAGEALWRQGQLVQSSIVRAPIQATCADCHTDDGRDLKYFNYSNYSIVQRAQFHGLTRTQGRQIASYIRTLTNADGTAVPTPGRPWNPPYQPGPGLDEQPVQSWAAGAGVNAVLDKDSDMMPYVFPNGVTKDAISTEGNLNVRELPIPLQLLDWNHWLPVVHPKDSYGSAFLQDRAFTDYGQIKANLTGPNAQAYKTAHVGNDQPSAYMTQVRSDLGRWFYDYGFVFAYPRTQTTLTPAASEAVYSSGLWQRVKVWGLMQQFGLEELGKTAFGPRAETRTWLDSGSFDISPGKSHLPEDVTTGGFSANPLNAETLDNQWYYLGLIQNPGNGYRAGATPVDYPYARNRNLNLTQAGGPALPLMELVWTTKGSQQGAGQALSDNFGWAPVGTGDLTQMFYQDNWLLSQYPHAGSGDGWAPGAEKPVMQAAMETWFDKVQSYTPQQYYAAGIADPAYTPVVRDNGLLGDKVMAYLYYAKGVGVDPSLLSQIQNWGKTVWPKGNWTIVPSQ